MTRIRARRTKAVTMQARMEADVKDTLQKYAERQGVNLSELIRKTLKDLADHVEAEVRNREILKRHAERQGIPLHRLESMAIRDLAEKLEKGDGSTNPSGSPAD